MSKRALEQVLMRALSDAEFRAQLSRAPEVALGRYDLSEDERPATLAANTAALLDFGVDKRLVQMLPPSIYRLS